MKTKITITRIIGFFALVLFLGFSQRAAATITVTQQQGLIAASQPYGIGTTLQRLTEVKVQIVAPDVATNVTNLQFTLTNPEQIARVAVYASSTSGGPDPYSASTMLGTAITDPTASVSFTGSISSAVGSRYYILLVDIKPTATAGTVIDATCTSATVGATTYTSISNTTNRDAVIADNLTGTKTVKTSSGDYATLNDAIKAINNYGVGTGGVTITVEDGQTFTHSTLDATYNYIRQATSATNTITIKQSGTGAKPIINSAASSAGIQSYIAGYCTDYLTIDGLDFRETGSATSTVKLEKPIYFLGTATDGCSNNEVKNCVINPGHAFSSGGVLGISFKSPGATSTGGANNNNKIHHNTVTNTEFGIDFGSTTSAAPTNATMNDTGNEVYNNNITGVFSNAGINFKYCTDTKVYNNTLDGSAATTTQGGTRTGISAGSTCTGYIDCYGNTVKNMSINPAAAQTISGISLIANTVNIYNNVIANVANNFTTAHTKGTNGILMSGNGTLAPTYNVYHNSIYMNQTAANTTARTTCIAQEEATAANVTAMNLINNVFVNTSNNGSPNNFTLYIPTATVAAKLGATTDNNLYYPETNIKWGTAYATLADYKAALVTATPTREAASVTGDPLYVAPATSDLSITNTASPAYNTGKTGLSVTMDIAGLSRAITPDMGAYEIWGSLTAPVATAATVLTGRTAFANWGVVADATGYTVTVTDLTNGTSYGPFYAIGGATVTKQLFLGSLRQFNYTVTATNSFGSSPASNVIAFELNVTTPINTPVENKVYVSNGQLVVTGASAYTVYNSQGVEVAKANSSDRIVLRSGIYVVKVGNKTQKVFVR